MTSTTLKHALAAAAPPCRARRDVAATLRRGRAVPRLRRAGLPTPRREDWRYTDLEPLAKRELRPVLARAPGLRGARRGARRSRSLRRTTCTRLVLRRRPPRRRQLGSRRTPLPPDRSLQTRRRHRLRSDAPAARWLSRRRTRSPRSTRHYAQIRRVAPVADGVAVAGADPSSCSSRAACAALAPQPRIVRRARRGAGGTSVQHFVDGGGRPTRWLNVVTEIDAGRGRRALTCYRLQRARARTPRTRTRSHVDMRRDAIASLGARRPRRPPRPQRHRREARAGPARASSSSACCSRAAAPAPRRPHARSITPRRTRAATKRSAASSASAAAACSTAKSSCSRRAQNRRDASRATTCCSSRPRRDRHASPSSRSTPTTSSAATARRSASSTPSDLFYLRSRGLDEADARSC